MPVTNPPRATRATRASGARQAAVARVEAKLAQGARTNPLTASGRGANGAHHAEGAARRRDPNRDPNRDRKLRSAETDTNTAILEHQLAHGLRVANAPKGNKGKDKRKPVNTSTAVGDGHGSPMPQHLYKDFYDPANKFSPLGEETWPGASPEYASEVQPSASPSPVRPFGFTMGYDGFTMGDGDPIPFATKLENLDAFDNEHAVSQSEWDAKAQYGSMDGDSAVFTGLDGPLSGYTMQDGIFKSDPPSPLKPSDAKKSVRFNPTLDQTAYFRTDDDDAHGALSFPSDELREFNQPATPLLPAVATAGRKQPAQPAQGCEDLGLRGPNDVQSFWHTKDLSDYLDAHEKGELEAMS